MMEGLEGGRGAEKQRDHQACNLHERAAGRSMAPKVGQSNAEREKESGCERKGGWEGLGRVCVVCCARTWTSSTCR